tara:strand:- start:61 stop:330 length:270 start_codon:yes stop_codon:yes gene_type:complete
MAEHMLKKYIAKVEKTVYVIETIEFICETEREAEEHLDNYCSSTGMYGEDYDTEVVDIEEQEYHIDGHWIEESTVLSVDEYMEYKDGLH